ncbi:hypothetical protein ACNI3K_05205 [Demequina sp. SO4-13]|uniref:hypothetical protein n=1 Tax=Demequina sp. SO4-13 TaxID=3401027 RepID=UPI003AF8DBC9
MPDARDDRPRTWAPLVAAGAVGAVVVGVAVAAFALGGRPGETESAVIAACEAEQARGGGETVVAGDVYDPTGWRDYYAVAEASGEVATPLAEVEQDVIDRWEATADQFRADGEGVWVTVWLLDDDSYAQCTVPVMNGSVDAASAAVGPLEAPPSGGWG